MYDAIGEGLPAGAKWPRPGELPERRDAIIETGLFEVLHVQHFDWEQVYDAEAYIDLLETLLCQDASGAPLAACSVQL